MTQTIVWATHRLCCEKQRQCEVVSGQGNGGGILLNRAEEVQGRGLTASRLRFNFCFLMDAYGYLQCASIHIGSHTDL